MHLLAKNARTLFAIVLLAHLFFIYKDLPDGRFATKMLLLPLLMIYLVASVRLSTKKVSTIIIAGLVLSFIGDMVLTQTGTTMFLLGMVAFIGTHICNSIFFIRLQKGVKGRMGVIVTTSIVMLVLSLGVFVYLQNQLGDFQVPIIAYMCIISTMAVLAAGTARDPSLQKTATHYLIPGAILFVVSDALLASNKFAWHLPMVDIAVMLTYGLAQYFLVRGFLKITLQQAG